MCGFFGMLGFRERIDIARCHYSLRSIKHRGPDALGHWVSNCERRYLGHARLSVIDLSESANQPLSIDDGSLVISFNGEIYNYLDLRDRLSKRGIKFRTQSDTEVILYAYKEFGPDCLNLLDGMFAFAIVDTRSGSGNGQLFLARDRWGKAALLSFVRG